VYTPVHFAEQREPVLRELIKARPLATLIVSTPRGLDAQHLPLLLDETRASPGALQGHVAKANLVWSEVASGAEVLAVFHGPQHYVSPSWYPSKREHGKVVPTWNYVVVHARGTITWNTDSAWLRALLERTTSSQESPRPEPWRIDEAPASFVDRNIEAIVGLEIAVHELTGKWKLSQNRSAADRSGVVAGLLAEGGDDAVDLANLMRDRDEN
jgi:transcriptional regulator